MSGFDPMGSLFGFMNNIPSTQNNNPMGMLGGIVNMLGAGAAQNGDPRINQAMGGIQNLLQGVGGMMGPSDGSPPVQGPNGIPGLRSNPYGAMSNAYGMNQPQSPTQQPNMGSYAPQEVMSLISGLMSNGGSMAQNMRQPGSGHVPQAYANAGYGQGPYGTDASQYSNPNAVPPSVQAMTASSPQPQYRPQYSPQQQQYPQYAQSQQPGIGSSVGSWIRNKVGGMFGGSSAPSGGDDMTGLY